MYLIFLLKIMIVEILLNKKVQVCKKIDSKFFKGKINKCVHDWKNIKNELSILSFEQNIDKILNKKVDICAMFKTKHELNKIHPSMVS